MFIKANNLDSRKKLDYETIIYSPVVYWDCMNDILRRLQSYSEHLFRELISHFDFPTLVRASLVCKSWNKFVQQVIKQRYFGGLHISILISRYSSCLQYCGRCANHCKRSKIYKPKSDEFAFHSLFPRSITWNRYNDSNAKSISWFLLSTHFKLCLYNSNFYLVVIVEFIK